MHVSDQIYNMLYENQQAADDDQITDYGFIKDNETYVNPYDPSAEHFEPFQHDYSRYPDSYKKYEKSFTKYQQYKEYFQNTPQEYPNFIDQDKQYMVNDEAFKSKF